MASQIFPNFWQKGYPCGKNRRFKIFASKHKKHVLLYSNTRWVRIRCQKNSKKFLKKVMGQKLFGTQTLPTHNFPRLKWTPTCYIFFWHSGDALQYRLFKSGFTFSFGNSTQVPVTCPPITPQIPFPDSNVRDYFCRRHSPP